jgi:hypothetical protein
VFLRSLVYIPPNITWKSPVLCSQNWTKLTEWCSQWRNNEYPVRHQLNFEHCLEKCQASKSLYRTAVSVLHVSSSAVNTSWAWRQTHPLWIASDDLQSTWRFSTLHYIISNYDAVFYFSPYDTISLRFYTVHYDARRKYVIFRNDAHSKFIILK